MHSLLRHLGAAAALTTLLACDPPDEATPRVGAPPDCECWAMCQESNMYGQPGVIEQIVVPITLEPGQACEVNATTRDLVDDACCEKSFANGGLCGLVVGDEPKYQCASN